LPTVEDLLGQPHHHATLVQNMSDLHDYSALDYSLLPDLAASLMSVLPANPTFFQPGDFRITYEKGVKRVIKQARLVLKTATTSSNSSNIRSAVIIPTDKPHVCLIRRTSPLLPD
jgi:hypothetical protein